ELAEQQGMENDWLDQLKEAVEQGQRTYNSAQRLEASLTLHKALEDEGKQQKAILKGIENKRDELVASAREKISEDEARVIIIDRLEQLLRATYRGYLRAEQRACIKAVENLWR